MRKKGIKIWGLILVLLVIVLFVVPVIFKKQISEKVKEEMNSQINGHVDYTDFSFSLLTHFPNPTILLRQFVLTGGPNFKKDTVASVQNFSFSVDLWSVLRGHDYRVLSFNVDHPAINLRVNGAGRANWNMMKYALSFSKGGGGDAPGGKQADFSLRVCKLKIEHAYVGFKDDTAHTLLLAADWNSIGTDTVGKEGEYFGTSTTIGELTLQAAGMALLSKTKLNADIKFSSNDSGQYAFFANSVSLNDLHISGGGSVKSTKDGLMYNMSLHSIDSSFSALLSLIPALSDTGSGKLKPTGRFSISGDVKGLYHDNQYPAISLKMMVENGSFQKEGLPVAVKSVNLSATAMKPQGPMDSMIIQSQLHIETGKDTANATMRITTPSTDANIQATLSGSVEPQLVPGLRRDERQSKTSGLLVNFKFNERKSDMDNKSYKDAQAVGSSTLLNCIFQRPDMPIAVHIAQAGFSWHNGVIALDKLSASMGKSEFSATGKIERLANYFGGQGRLLVIVNLSSDLVARKDLMTDFGTSKIDAQVAPPAKGSSKPSVSASEKVWGGYPDLNVNMDIKKFIYDNVTVEHLKGQLQLAGNKFYARDVAAGFAGGNVLLNSTCENALVINPAFNFTLNFTNMNMQQVYKAIRQAGVDAASLQNISGSFSGKLAGSGKLSGEDLHFNQLKADGSISMPDLKVDELPLLMDISKLAKVKSFEHMEAKNIQCVFHFANGKTSIDPTDIKFTSGTKITFKGTSDIAQNVDADIDLAVPMKEFGQVASLAQNILGGFMKVPENMQFKFKVTGKMNNPVVNLAGMGTD